MVTKREKSEADALDLINAQLRDKGWKDDQVTRETHPAAIRKLLGGKRPDCILYAQGGERPFAVIEAKRPKKDLRQAVQQGLAYARKISELGCRVVFASDGTVVKTAHVLTGHPLLINGEEVREFLAERRLLNFLGSHLWVRGEIINNSTRLIALFNSAGRVLRREGLVNIDAFAEFSRILFFKILSEIYDEEKNTNPPAHWRDLIDKSGDALLNTYKAGISDMENRYPGVFGKTDIKKGETIERIVAKINRFSFIDVDADIKGDAYEYFLRRYNRQKSDLAQYFTPRHVVRAMVVLCNPRFRETVYDPFCGTGGMLIQAFKHIRQHHLSQKMGEKEMRFLRQRSVFGTDISRSADTARMNMILAGDGHSNIEQKDSLDAKKDDNKKYHVIITNIPFGGDETACIRHCLEKAVKDSRQNGRVCLIVPERVMDSRQASYVEIRKTLTRYWTIQRVISLPREVFRGFTSAKTSVIYATFGNPKGDKIKRVLVPYFAVKNDGYTLDKKRDPILGVNDLDTLLEDRDEGKECLKHYATEDNGWRFKPPDDSNALRFKYPKSSLRELVRVQNRRIRITNDMVCKEPGFIGKTHKIWLKEERMGYNVKTKTRFKIVRGDLVFAKLHTQNGLFAVSDGEYHGTSTHFVCTIDESVVDRDYLFWALDMVVPTLSMSDTTGRENYSSADILGLPVPLPNINEQKKIARELKEAWSALQKSEENFENKKTLFSSKLIRL